MNLSPQDRGPLIIAGGIVIAGLFIAVALYLSRSSAPGEDAAPPAAARPASVSVAPPKPTPEVSRTAQDEEAQANLTKVLRAAQGVVSETGTYATATGFELARRVPEFTYLPSVRASTRPGEISLAPGTATWAAAALSESGTCFWVKDTIDAASGTTVTTYGAGTPCTGRAAENAASGSWPA